MSSLSFVKTFIDPASGRQILAMRRNLRKYGPAVVFSTRMENGEFMDRVYYSGEDTEESRAAVDEFFDELTTEIAVYQINHTIADFAVTGNTGEKPEEIEGTSANVTLSQAVDNPEEE